MYNVNPFFCIDILVLLLHRSQRMAKYLVTYVLSALDFVSTTGVLVCPGVSVGYKKEE